MPLFRGARRDPFPGAVQPAELKQVAGQWLATALADQGFTWLKTGEVARRLGTRKEFLGWSASKFNSADGGSSFDMFAVVQDSGLANWRKANAGRVLHDGDFVANQANRHHRLRISGAATRQAALDDCLAWHREVPLPWFSSMREPEWVACDMPILGGSIGPQVEWLLWQERSDLVPQLVQRANSTWVARRVDPEPDLVHGRQMFRSGKPTGVETNSNGIVALGWLLEAQGL